MVLSESADPNAHPVLTLRGDIDVVQADQLVIEGAAILRDTPPGQYLAIDLAGVDFMDSSGISALLRLRRNALQRKVEVRLRGVPEHVAVLLRISGLEQVLPAE
jgi:anti-sigma B factor antagonist